jgi:serine protease Do
MKSMLDPLNFLRRKPLLPLFLSGCLFLYAFPVFSLENPRENAVVRAVRKTSPAVVNISSEYEVRKRLSLPGFNPFFDSFFKDFFDPRFQQHDTGSSLGSGVIIDGRSGYILTNAHVVEKTGKLTVTLNDGREFQAQIIGVDPDSDLAVLRIESKDPLPALEMGNSDDLMIGETVIAIGNPFGFSNTVTTGVISSLGRSVRADDRIFNDFIQLDASINPGNSGGPLLSIDGALIGINTAIYAKAQGIGFAIPINKARRVVSDLIRHGEVIPAWIGLKVQTLDERLSRLFDLSGRSGLFVREVEPGSPAARSGVKEGEIVLGIGKKKVVGVSGYNSILRDFAAGDRVELHLFRDGKERTVTVEAAVFPIESALALAYDLLGIRAEGLSSRKRTARQTAQGEGVLISEIDAKAHLARIGVVPGDIVRQINDMPVSSLDDFKRGIVKYRDRESLILLIQRGEKIYRITTRINPD